MRDRSRRPLRVVQYEPSGSGGFCQYTHQLAEALARQGCDVTVMTKGGYELQHLPRRFRTRFLFRPSRMKRLLSLLVPDRRRASLDHRSPAGEAPGRDAITRLRAFRLRLLQLQTALWLLWRRPDVVHFQSAVRGRELFLIRLLHRLRLRVICTAHDLLPHDSTSEQEWKAHAEIYRIVDQVIVHAEDNRREMIDVFDIDPDRISVIPHGSYHLLLPDGRLPKDHARAALGLPADARIVLFFGLIKRYKGLEFLFEAFRRVEEAIPDAFLVVVGDIFRADQDGYQYYSRLIEEASTRKNVRCVARYLPIGEIAPYLSAADVIALPYTKTYQSGVLLSAYAAGRPVVVTATGGLPEMVTAGKTGFVVPPRDPASLAAAIQNVLAEPGLADEMGENAARLADSVYSWDTIARSTVALYEEVIARRSASAAERAGRERRKAVGVPANEAGRRESRP